MQNAISKLVAVGLDYLRANRFQNFAICMPLFGAPKYLRFAGNLGVFETAGPDHFGNFGQLSEFINIIYQGTSGILAP